MPEVKSYPHMNEPEIEAMRELIAKADRVLEWGSGGSTLYWPAEFPEIEWVSIEHDPAYYRAIADRVPENVDLCLIDYPDYFQLDVGEVGTFDLIIVDGRKRLQCMEQARTLLNDGGVVALHDCSRERYAFAERLYQEHEVVVPPTRTKDPRGLTVFRGTEPEWTAPIAECGVIYMCWGLPATHEAEKSMKSLWDHEPDMPTAVVGDERATDYFDDQRVTTILCDVDPFVSETRQGFHAGRIKPLLARMSPFERTLYVDAESAFSRSPMVGFDLLDRWDFVVAEAETRSLAKTPLNRKEATQTAEWLGTMHILYHNSGMLFWRRTEEVARLMDLWAVEWRRYQNWDEQVALLRALLRSDALWLNVPYTWNCRSPSATFLLYHRFASLDARKFHARSSRSRRHRRERHPSPLVSVEVSPGRFVKCHPGDEDKVIEMFEQRQGRRR